jgi:hypothetical protein
MLQFGAASTKKANSYSPVWNVNTGRTANLTLSVSRQHACLGVIEFVYSIRPPAPRHPNAATGDGGQLLLQMAVIRSPRRAGRFAQLCRRPAIRSFVGRDRRPQTAITRCEIHSGLSSFRHLQRHLFDEHRCSFRRIALIETAAYHVRRNLTCALLVKLVPGSELEFSIGTSQRSLQTRMKKAVRFDHDHAGSAAIRMAVGQPKEGHELSVAGGQSAPVTLGACLVHRFPDTDPILAMREDSVFRHAV